MTSLVSESENVFSLKWKIGLNVFRCHLINCFTYSISENIILPESIRYFDIIIILGNNIVDQCELFHYLLFILYIYQLYTIYFYVAENFQYPLITFSIASNKSFSLIAFLLALIANIPASVHTLLISAPVVFGHNLIIFNIFTLQVIHNEYSFPYSLFWHEF